MKRYYAPRILFGVEETLQSTFPNALICLSGPELAMLRNLTAYLHRRSSWVSEYRQDDYLAPGADEWDAVEAAVAVLEEKLMSCEDFAETLADILAAAQCACDRADPMYGTPGTSAQYYYYIDNGDLEVGNDESDDETEEVDETCCAIACLTWQAAYEILVETIQPQQRKWQDWLLPPVMVVLAIHFGGPISGIKFTTVYELINASIDAWVESEFLNVSNTLTSYRDELVCAIYTTLRDGGSFADAESACVDIIASMPDISPLDKIMFHVLFAPWALAKARRNWEDETEWALANYDEDLCVSCLPETLPFVREWEFPPCRGEWTGGQCSTYVDGQARLCVNGVAGSNEALSPVIPWNLGGTRDVVLYIYYYMGGNPGTHGYLNLDWSPDGIGSWVNKATTSITGTIPWNWNTIQVEQEDKVIPNGYLRYRMNGQTGQGQTTPYPVNAARLRFTIKEQD